MYQPSVLRFTETGLLGKEDFQPEKHWVNNLEPRVLLYSKSDTISSEKAVVLARGTSATGKTSLARLFANWVNEGRSKRYKYAVFLSAAWATWKKVSSEEYIKRERRVPGHYRANKDLVIVINDSHHTYRGIGLRQVDSSRSRRRFF